nr:DUF2513 domain-containing protein [Roseococcus thiosulfatophilus]
MDFVRDILIAIEQDSRFDATSRWQIDDPTEIGLAGRTPEEFAYHLTLLIEAGLIVGEPRMHGPVIGRLTWQGHEFVSDVRDPAIWRRTKQGANAAGNAGIQFMWELAKAYGKQVARERLGIDLP